MNLCLTPRSVKLLATYFKNNLPGIVDNNKSYDQIQRELFDTALSDFQTPESKQRDRELIIQHLTILPQVLFEYMGENPSITNPNLFTQVNSLRSTVYNASQTGEIEDFQHIIDEITSAVGVSPMIITGGSPVIYNAVSYILPRERGQVAIWNEKDGYSPNLIDPNKVREDNVRGNIISSNNAENYQFRLSTVGKVLSEGASYEYDQSNMEKPVLLIVDENGSPVKFDESGEVSPTGTSLALPVQVDKSEFDYMMASQIESLLMSEQMTQEQAEEYVNDEVDAYVGMMGRAVEKMRAGETVNLQMNMAESSLGFTQLKTDRQTPISAVTNLAETRVVIAQKGKSNSPELQIPHSNSNAKIFNNTLDSLSEDQVNNLIELFTNPNLTYKGQPLTLAKRQQLITTFMQFKGQNKKDKDVVFSIKPNAEGTMISSIVVGDKRMQVSGKDFVQKFKDSISKFHGFQYKGPLPNNYPIAQSIEDVTHQNQLFYDNGEVKIARKIEINFGLYRGVNLNTPVETVGSIENGNIIPATQDRAEYIKENGYTIVVPNAEGKLRGYGGYIAFQSLEDRTAIEDEGEYQFFSSVADLNSRTKAIEKEETAADKWWSSHPLRNVVNVSISNEVHERGEAFVAEFAGDSIMLYAGADKTEIYHEAFHAYVQGMLSAEERGSLFNEVRGLKGEFTTTVYGKSNTVKFSEATDLQIEEYLASEFKEYARGNRKYKSTSKIGQFFEMLLEKLKGLFGNYTPNEVRYLNSFGPQTAAIFKDLYQGNVNESKFVAPSSRIKRYSSFEGSQEMDLSYQEMAVTMDSMRALMTMFVSTALNTTTDPAKNLQLTNMMTEMASHHPDSAEFKQAASALNQELSTLGPRNGQGILRLTTNPATMSAALNYIKNSLETKRNTFATSDGVIERENVETLNKVLEHFGDPTAPLSSFKKDKSTIIGIFLNDHAGLTLDQTFQEDIAWNDENLEDNFRLVFDRTGAEQTIDEAANELTRQVLGGIISYKNDGRGEMRLNRFGIPELLPFKTAIAKVVKVVGNRVDLDNIYGALHNASVNDKEIHQVLKMLGFLGAENTTEIEQKQWGALWQSVAKATNNLRYFSLEKVDNNETEEVSYKAISGRSQESLKVINANWRDNFKFESERNLDFYTADETNGDERYLAADDLGIHIAEEYEDMVLIPMSPSKELYHETRNPKARYDSDPNKRRLKRWQADPFSLLELIGIELPNTHEVRDILVHGSEELGIEPGVLEYIIESVKNRVTAKYDADKKIYNLEDLFKKFTYNGIEAGKAVPLVQQDVSGYYKQLQSIAQHLSDQHINFSAFNAKGDRQSEKTKHSSLTVIVSTLNNAGTYEELIETPGMEGFNYETNPHIVGSTWFRQMFNLDSTINFGERNYDISITTETLSGSKIIYAGTDKGVAAIDSDEHTKFITDFHLTLDGRQEIMRSEAKSTSHTVSAPVRVKGDRAVRRGLVINNVEVAAIFSEEYEQNQNEDNALYLYDQFVHHLEAELIRINRIKEIKKMVENGEKVNFDAKYLARGEDFFMFDLLLPAALQKKLNKKGITESFSLDKDLTFEEKKEIETALKHYFEVRADELMKEKGERLKIGDNVLSENQLNEAETEEQVKERLMKVFLINNFINNANYASLFLGDSAIYNVEGEDYHKRIAGLISTGDLFRFDSTWLDFLNKPKMKIRGFEEKYATENNLEYKGRPYTGHLNTGVIAESKHDSVYLKHYADVAGIPVEDYGSMEEADGAGWISFDAYRLLLMSSNEWSDGQEEVYQKLLAGKEFNPMEIRATFPIKKYQYYGDVTNADGNTYGLQPKAFHKYSLAPIVPGLIEGKAMQGLHERMMAQGIDYVTMASGSKLSTLVNMETGQPDDVYNKDREITDVPFTVNRIHVRGLKNQVKVGEGYKGYITLPTQWRKMAMLGVMDGNGVPTDYTGKKSWNSLSESQKLSESKNYRWLNKFENILARMQVHYKEELLHDIGMKEVDTPDGVQYEGGTEKLVQYIQKQLKNEDMLPEEVQFIMNPDGTMIDDLSLSLNAEKIEKILTVMVDKKLRRLKVNGEPLIQMSGAMQESMFDKPTEADLANYGTNGLKTYYLKDEEGNIVTEVGEDGLDKYVVSKMEVKVALQGDFQHLLQLTHPDEKKIAVYKGGKLDFNASLDRLNEAIKNTEWAGKHEKLLTLSGPRIPSQQENSLEAAVVKEFLPPHAGNLIILPSEIVAKAGSDFDIDKLFLMFPNIININGNVKLQEYGEVEELMEDLQDDLESFNIVLSQEYTKRDEILDQRHQELAKTREIKDEMRTVNAEAYEKLTEWKQRRVLLMEEASEAYKAVGRYEGATREEQIAVHSRTSPEINELTRLIDTTYEALNDMYNSVIENNEGVSHIKDIYDKYKEPLAEVRAEISKLRDQRAPIEEKISMRGIGGLENQLLDAFQERITMGNNFSNLVKTNSTSFFTDKDASGKSLVEQADALGTKTYDKRNRLDGKSQSTIARSTIFDYRYNLLKHQENSVGMDSLGIAAIAATYYAMFSRMGATLNATTPEKVQAYFSALKVLENQGDHSEFDIRNAKKTVKEFGNYRLKFNHNTVTDQLGEHIAMGFLKNVDGKTISEVIGQLINGYVDVAKDPWIFKIQGNKQNTPQLLFMAMSGMSTKDIVYFTSMPLVVEYNKLKAEMSGVFSDLSTEWQADPIVSSSRVATRARQEMFKKYSDMLKAQGFHKASQYKVIANGINTTFDAASLGDIANNDPQGWEAFQALTHYFEVEDMSNHMTEFQGLTKFDTQKVSSISEAQDRIDRTAEFKSTETSIPNQWFEDIKSTAVGVFNNDEFIVKMFSRYFGLRNNPMVIKESLNANVPKGQIKTVFHNNFKNDFLFFLYQNSLYADGTYSGYTLQESDDYMAPLEIDETDPLKPTVTYGKGYMEQRKAEVTQVIAGPNGFVDLNDMFPTEGHFTRFEIEFQKIEQETEGMTNAQILEHLDVANSYSAGTGTPIGVKYKMALYRSNNNVAMFDYRMGMGSILRKIKQRNPNLAEQFSLVNDIRFDYAPQERKTNMWLSEVKDPDMARVYIENLQNLKNHPTPEVADFFRRFENMIIMQSGMNRRGKHDMAKLVDQTIFNDVIENGIGVDRVLRDLNNTEALIAQGEADARSKYLNAFTKMYSPISSDKKAYLLRVRGMNLMTDDLKAGTEAETAVLSSMTYNNVSIVNNFNDVPAGTVELHAEELYNDEDGGLNQDYINEIKEKPIYILDRKLQAPEGESQIELDAVLKTVFGINNAGKNPSLIAMSLGQTEDNISIATAEGIKMQHAHKDEAMANEAHVAIGQATIGSPTYTSSSQLYVDEINRKYSDRLADKKTKFKSADKVWIFGSGIFANAYKGMDGGKAAFEAMVNDTFESYHKPVINKAIKAGVTSFLVGNASGIDKMAHDHLTEQGYTPVTRFASTGKYTEFVKEVNAQTSPLYDVTKEGTKISNIGLGYVYNTELEKKVNRMKEEEILTSSPYEIVKADIISRTMDRFPNNQSRRYNFFEQMAQNPGALLVGDSNYSSLVERVLMELRADYVDMQARKSIASGIGIRQKKVDPASLPEINVVFSNENMMKIFNNEKITTVRNTRGANQLGLEKGESAVFTIAGMKYTITNRGQQTVTEAGGAKAMATAEGLPTAPTRTNIHPIEIEGTTYYTQYKQTARWLNTKDTGVMTMNVYDIAPAVGETQYLNRLNQNDIDNLPNTCE